LKDELFRLLDDLDRPSLGEICLDRSVSAVLKLINLRLSLGKADILSDYVELPPLILVAAPGRREVRRGDFLR
jgi:hypothetical protein